MEKTRPSGTTSSDAERPTLKRTKSEPALEKPEFGIEIDLERFTGKGVAGISEVLEEQQVRQEKQAQIKKLARRMNKAMSDQSPRFDETPLTEQELKLAFAELVSAARTARETAYADGRDPSQAPSVSSISSDNSVIAPRLPEGAADTILPGLGTQTDLPRPLSPKQNNNRTHQDRSWAPIHAPTEFCAMREGLVYWDNAPYNRPLPYIGNGNLTLSEATQPSTASPTDEIPELEHRMATQQAQSERLRTRGADMTSMAGATAFDHTGALIVFTSFSTRHNRVKTAREWTMHESINREPSNKYRWDVTDSEVGDGKVEEKGQEQRIGKSEGYRTIYSYFQPVFRHRQGVPPERVRYEMRNGYLHVDGMQVPHLPGFEYGLGYADEKTSQRMIRQRQRTSRHVARPVRTRPASQFGQFALQVTADDRERLRNRRNRIPERIYCEEDGYGQSSNLEGNLRFHRRLRHGPVETHRCEECPKSFRHENQLARHQRIHERQKREALVQAVLDNEGDHSQKASESALPSTARSSAETLRTFEAFAEFDELPRRLDDTEVVQQQDSEKNSNAEEEHTGTASTGTDPPGSDDGDDHVGLRGGLHEGPRPWHRRISYLIHMLKCTSLPEFDLNCRFNQKYGRWRSVLTTNSLYNPTPEDDKWKAFWIEWTEAQPRVAGTPPDIVTHAEVSGAIEKIRELDLADPKLSACLFGLYVARKETFWAVNGHIFDFLLNRDAVSTDLLQKAPIGAYLSDSHDDGENVRLRGGADGSSTALEFAPATRSISYLAQMAKDPYESDALRHLHQRKIDELTSLNSAGFIHNPTKDDLRWKIFWIYWKDNGRETIPRLEHSWVLTTDEVVVAPDLSEPDLSYLLALCALEKPTFMGVNECIFVLLSRRTRNGAPLSTGSSQRAPVGDEFLARRASVGALDDEEDDDAEDVEPGDGLSARPSTFEIVNVVRGLSMHEPDRTFPPIEQGQVYISAFEPLKNDHDLCVDDRDGKVHWDGWTDSTRIDIANIGYFRRLKAPEKDTSTTDEALEGEFWIEIPSETSTISKHYRPSEEAAPVVPTECEASERGVPTEAQDAPQAACDGASGNVDEDASVTLSEGKADYHRHSCAQQRESNTQDTRSGGRSQPMWHSRNHDASASQQSSHMTGEGLGEGVSTHEPFKSTTLLRHPQFSEAASTEAAEKEARGKIRAIALLKVLGYLSGVRGDMKAFGEPLHLFMTKFGLAATAIQSRFQKAGQTLLNAVLSMTKGAVPAEAQEKLHEPMTSGKTEGTEEAEGCAKILNSNRRLKLELEGARRRRHGIDNRDSGLHGGALDSAVPAEENPPSEGRYIATLKTLNDLNGLGRNIRAFGKIFGAFIAKVGCARTRVRANVDRAGKEILHMFLGLTWEELLTQARETIGRIFEAVNYGKERPIEDAESCAWFLCLVRGARVESERISRRRHGGVSKEFALRCGAGVYYLPAGAAFELRRQVDYMPPRPGVHRLMAIDRRPFGTCGLQKDKGVDMNTSQCDIDAVFANGRIQRLPLIMQAKQGGIVDARFRPLKHNTAMETICEPALEEIIKKTSECWCGSEMRCMHHEAIHKPGLVLSGFGEARQLLGKVSQLRGGDFKDPEAMRQLEKPVEQYTADGSNGMMSENNTCQLDRGRNFCSTHQMHYSSSSSISTCKLNVLHQPTVGTRLPNEEPTKQPLPAHSHRTYAIPPGRALLFGQPSSQPCDPSLVWQSNTFSTTNGAVGLNGQANMCYYPDPVNSHFCTTHHIIHGSLKRPPPSSYIAPYALDETTLMAQARSFTLRLPYALDEAALTAQARAVTLGFVKNGVPDVAMLQHQAKVHASQAFGQNPQWAHEMQPSARSRLWAAQGGAYFGRGLRQTPSLSRIASCSQNVAKKAEDDWGEASFNPSIGAMSDRTLAPGSEAENWKLQSSYCTMPAAMPLNTRKRQRASNIGADEGQGADASVPNQNAKKRTKRATFTGIEQRRHQATCSKTSSSVVNQYDDCEMVDAPLTFDQILQNERKLMQGATDAQDRANGMCFGDGSGPLRGGSLADDVHDAHTHGSSTLPLRTAQQSTRQFSSCIGQVESGNSRIPCPVSPPDPLGQTPSLAPHVATTGLDGTNNENQNLFVGGERAEEEGGTQLNTDGFNVSFEVPPLTSDYPSARRNITWHATALRQMDEVLSIRRGREFVRRSRNGQLPSVLGRRQRSTSSSVSHPSRPAPATRDDSFASVASAQVPIHTLNPSARTALPSQQLANPLRQPFNPPHHALLDHPFIRSANGAVQPQVPFHNPNPLQPPLQPREVSNPQVYPVSTQRASTPEARRGIAWQEIDDAASLSNIDIAVEDARRARERLRRRQEAQRAVTPQARSRIPWGDEADMGGSLSDLGNPEEFVHRSRRFRRRREALRRDRAPQGAALPMFSELSRLPRPEMSGGLGLIEDDIWERNHRLAREAESAPLYLRSFVDALPTGTVGGVHGDRATYIDALMRSTAASGHGAGERGGVPEGVWYNITFERRLDSKPQRKGRRLNGRRGPHGDGVDEDDHFSDAESDEDEEYVVFSWGVQIPAGGMKDLLRSTGTEWGVKAVRARDWALEELAIDPKGDVCTEAIGEWWEAVRGGASRDERCRIVGVRVLEP